MGLRALILNHFWLKLFSLFLAMLIWLAVWGNLRNESLFPRKFAPVEPTRLFLNRPIMVLTDTAERPALLVDPDHASVSVRGPAPLLEELKDEEIQVFIRVGSKHPLGGEFPIFVHVPFGAAVGRVTPSTAAVRTAPNP